MVRRIAFPEESRLSATLPAATYHDAFETDLSDMDLTAAGIARRALTASPPWLDGLLALRDRLVRPFKVRAVGRPGAVGSTPDADWRVGDRFGFFRIESIDDAELVLALDDTHLDVRVSFLRRGRDRRPNYAISSMVTTHNAFGRAYMVVVGPINRWLVRAMMTGVPI